MHNIFVRDILVHFTLDTDEEVCSEIRDLQARVTLWADLGGIGTRAPVNYKNIKNRIFSMADEAPLHRMETMAEKIAWACLEEDKIKKVKVRMDHPFGPWFAKRAGVEIIRNQPS